MASSKLDRLSEEIREGRIVVNVDLTNCGIEELPPVLEAVAETVESLNLGGKRVGGWSKKS